MYPISDLTTFCRKTSGDVPPKLVGASTTVVGNKMYLYGGRLVAERRMVTDIYMFNLETFNWERIPQGPEHDMPRARYFHSADTWNNHLIIFGGMALQPDSSNPEELCVLNDVRLFNLSARRWLPANSDPSNSTMAPRARYAHLSSVSSNRLFIVGGQDLSNVWLDDVYVFDLRRQIWVHRRDYPRHCGTYRSVAVSANLAVRYPQEEIRPGDSTVKLGPSGSRFTKSQSTPVKYCTSPENLVHLPYSATPTDEFPSDIYLFSNYNFTNVQRELEVFKPSPGTDFTISDRSAAMTGTSFPPGLRFPAGAMLGTHFIVAGTYLTQSYQSFSIWALDLTTMTWSRIDPGSALSSGSWFRSCLWPEANKFLVFGNSHGNLAADYNRRLLSWDHVACIDLEAFGIYQHPPLYMSIENQELGLAALEEGVMADFDLVCEDGRKIPCSRRTLEERWPWFKQQRSLFLQSATKAMETLPPSYDVPLPELSKEARPDPRLTPRSLLLSESYPVSLAFLQYLYTQSLITPLQHAPAVLSQLLLLSSTYNLGHLQSLVKHAMHRALTYATSVGIYGVSTLCNCRSLQIRALRVVMAYSQKRPNAGRSSRDKESGGNNGRHDASRGTGTGGSANVPDPARPRGMSDVSFIQREVQASGGNGTMRGYTSASSDSTRDSLFDDGSLLDLVESFPATPTFRTPASIKDQQKPQILFGDCSSSASSSPSSPSLSRQSSYDKFSPIFARREILTAQTTPASSACSSPFTSPSELSPTPLHSPLSLFAPSISQDPSPSPTCESSLARKRLHGRNREIPQHIRIPEYSEFLHKRTFSVVSNNTDLDLCAVAELMTPIISGMSGHAAEDHGFSLDQKLNKEIDTYIREHSRKRSRDKGKQPERRIETIAESSSSPDEGSDVDSQLCERAYLSPVSTTYPAFHLPSPFTITASSSPSQDSDDTPSLTSSSSSFSTPSLQNLHSPPITPAGSDYGYNGLSIIQEQEQDGEHSPTISQTSPSEPMTFAPPPPDYFPPAKPFKFDNEEDEYGITYEDREKTSSPSEIKLEPLRFSSPSTSTLPRLEPVRQSIASSHTITQADYTSSRSSMISPMAASPAKPRTSRGFSRFVSLGSRVSKNFDKEDKGKGKETDSLQSSPSMGSLHDKPAWEQAWDKAVPAPSVRSVPESVFSGDSNSKSDDKKKKKEAAKARRDALAGELRAKQVKAKADQDKNSLNSKRSQGKTAVAWEEEGSMYTMKGIS